MSEPTAAPELTSQPKAEPPSQPVPVTIRPTDNGPYRVRGPVILEDAQGGRWDLPAGKSVFLCRCGHSETKPFCDNTHLRIGFESVVRAPGPEPDQDPDD